MPSELPQYVTNQIKGFLDAGSSTLSIATRLSISRSTVDSIRRNFELFGTAYPPRLVKRGRKPTLTEAQQQVSIAIDFRI